MAENLDVDKKVAVGSEAGKGILGRLKERFYPKRNPDNYVDNPSRREFVKGMGAFGALAAMPKGLETFEKFAKEVDGNKNKTEQEKSIDHTAVIDLPIDAYLFSIAEKTTKKYIPRSEKKYASKDEFRAVLLNDGEVQGYLLRDMINRLGNLQERSFTPEAKRMSVILGLPEPDVTKGGPATELMANNAVDYSFSFENCDDQVKGDPKMVIEFNTQDIIKRIAMAGNDKDVIALMMAGRITSEVQMFRREKGGLPKGIAKIEGEDGETYYFQLPLNEDGETKSYMVMTDDDGKPKLSVEGGVLQPLDKEKAEALKAAASKDTVEEVEHYPERTIPNLKEPLNPDNSEYTLEQLKEICAAFDGKEGRPYKMVIFPGGVVGSDIDRLKNKMDDYPENLLIVGGVGDQRVVADNNNMHTVSTLAGADIYVPGKVLPREPGETDSQLEHPQVSLYDEPVPDSYQAAADVLKLAEKIGGDTESLKNKLMDLAQNNEIGIGGFVNGKVTGSKSKVIDPEKVMAMVKPKQAEF